MLKRNMFSKVYKVRGLKVLEWNEKETKSSFKPNIDIIAFYCETSLTTARQSNVP